MQQVLLRKTNKNLVTDR